MPPYPDTADEDLLRAQVYRLLSRFLSGPLGSDDLKRAATLQGDNTAFGRAISAFAAVARTTTPQAAAHEYQTLFIGLVRGEVVPYGSYYLTGFLHEKPLAVLRADMRRLGLARGKDVAEPEDHIASLLEMMAILIEGSFGHPIPVAEQKAFFKTHIASWVQVLFRDLEATKGAALYAALGTIGRLFIEIEEQAFDMV